MAALPIAMLGATFLGLGAGIASMYSGESERESIQLLSGQHVRIQSRVRLSEEGKTTHPDSCLVASGDGTVTKIDTVARKATVRCNKNRRAAPEEFSAEDLEVIDSGINAPGISIPGGYLTEGASVRMLDSSKRTNKGKALASPFYNPVGTVMKIDTVEKQVVVLSFHLNKQSTAQEFYNIADLEFVSGPSADAREGAETGLKIKIGSTVELSKSGKEKYGTGLLTSFGNKSDTKKLADPKWEKFGIVKSINADPKDKTKLIVVVRCVSKDSKKEVLEQKYDFKDLEARPAISVERAGIAVFGGMAEIDTKVKLRVERKSAVASKSLGRSAFGDMGTVSDLEPSDPNNLKIFVTCNGINPDEQTGDWYQPEDLEIAEPEDTEGEAVFGGRVVVGSTVRIMQSARGKKCLGTPEFGDVGTVKGIDPSASDNQKVNVTCGRSDAKQSEWYDPRDLSLFFPVDESGSELEKAKVVLASAQKELSAWQLRPQIERRSKDGQADKNKLTKNVADAQAEVDRLSGVGLDNTKASEMRNDSEEKLDEAIKLKREIEALRLKLSRESTCKKPDRSKKYNTITEATVLEWMENMFISPIDYKALGAESLQYSNSYRVAFAELQTAFRSFGAQAKDDTAYNAYVALNKAKLELRKDLKLDRSDTESFANLDDTLLDVAKKQNDFDDIKPPTPYKIALKTIDEKLKKLQEITTQIQSAAYSGDSPAEKLLKRVGDLETKTKDDIGDNEDKLKEAVDKYNSSFRVEQGYKLDLDLAKRVYDDQVNKLKQRNYNITPNDNTKTANLFDKVDSSRLKYLTAQKETLKARKEQALISAKTTCSEITLQSVNDMKDKIKKIVDGKCNVITTTDSLLDNIDALITTRKRAFIMSQAVLDPKFGDPDQVIFQNPIDGIDERIKEIQKAMEIVENVPTLDNLNLLISLCGQYKNDGGLLYGAEHIELPAEPVNNCGENPGPAPTEPKTPLLKIPKIPVSVPGPTTVSETPPGTPPPEPEYENVPAPVECQFKVGDIVHITAPAFERNGRWVILNIIGCESVYVVPEGENESTVKPIQLLINEIEAVAPTGGKRKWPFYGRRSTRRQRGGVEQSAIDKAKADYDKATTDLDNYNTQINKSIRIRDTYPVEKRGEDAYKINESIANDTATINTIVTDLKQKQASAYATYLALQKTIETEREQSKVNDPFNENYVPPPQPPFRPTLMDNGVPVQRPTNLNFFNPPSMPGSSFDAGENKRQFNEAIRARDEKTRLQLEQNQKDIVAKQVQDERIQKEAVARVRKERERFQKELIKKEEKVKAEDAKKAEKIATKNARIDTQNAESNKIWSEYIKKYDQWKLVKDTYNVCLQEYRKALEKHKEACDKLIRAKAKQLGDDQIMRLQSRTVGSSLMLDEARKLMNDADELQRTVMASKTDLQFTLTSSSDADIAKIVGLYETEIQKLKTCISRGKEDAIAEYDKDLAEIEKRKREVTTKVFDVKSEQPQGSNDLSSLPVAELNQRISQVNSTISKLRSNGKSTIGEEKYLSKLRNALQAPKQGGRRMTMRHRRV